MHTKMKGEGIKGLFIEQIVPVMERHGYHFMKAKNVFVYGDREWTNECILRFTNWENDQLSLRTEYFVTCKKVSQLYKEAILEKDCMPICGVLDVGWAYKYLGIPLDDKPWFQMKIAKLHSLVQKWIVEFESVGLSFFKEMNDYEKVEKALDIFNVSGWAPLAVWTGERILHGICLYYLNTYDKRGTLGLFDLYREKIDEMEYSPIREQFERLERYMNCLPDRQPIPRRNEDKESPSK